MNNSNQHESSNDTSDLLQVANWALAAFAHCESVARTKEAKDEFRRRRDFAWSAIQKANAKDDDLVNFLTRIDRDAWRDEILGDHHKWPKAWEAFVTDARALLAKRKGRAS